MTKRIELRPAPPTLRAIESRTGGDGYAHSNNAIANRLIEIADEALRRARETLDLAPGEWAAVFDVCNGSWLLGRTSMSIQTLAVEVRDATVHGLEDRHDVDGEALATKLADMSFVERAAVYDTAMRFWADQVEWTPEGVRDVREG